MWTLPRGGGDIKRNQRRQWHSLILRAIKRPSRAGHLRFAGAKGIYHHLAQSLDPGFAQTADGRQNDLGDAGRLAEQGDAEGRAELPNMDRCCGSSLRTKNLALGPERALLPIEAPRASETEQAEEIRK